MADREADSAGAEGFVRVARTGELAEGQAKRVRVGKRWVALVRCGGGYYAVDDTCSHAEASLAEGEVSAADCSVECPLHGARFDLKTGAALSLPAFAPVATYEVRVNGESIEVSAKPRE